MKTIKVVAAIIRVDGRIYATQRGYGPYKDGWEFPGGKIEPGETPEQALVREIKEELDTIVEVGSQSADESRVRLPGIPSFNGLLYLYYQVRKPCTQGA